MLSPKRFLIILSLLVVVVAAALSLFLKWSKPRIIYEPLPEYDYVIVGAGTAGCVVARRLWEKTNASILVIEAGSTAPWISYIPLLAPALQLTGSDWAYKTLPQRFSQKALKNNQSAWSRGKGLGGSSSINYLLHMWGAPSDFDQLWTFENISEWSFNSVRQYFKRIETFKRPSGAPVPDFRGTEGPMPVTELDESSSPLVMAFLDGIRQLGIKIGDLNGDIEDGAMLSQSTISEGWRVSAFDAYLKPVLESTKIHLLTDTLVTKVVIDGKRATAVKALNTLTRYTRHIAAAREVIVSAGVIGSPQLLMLSGIGPERHLEDHNIPVILDLPGVGGNLMDHLNLPLYFHIDAPLSTTTAKARSLKSFWQYLTKGDGPLAHSGVESCVRLSGDRISPKMFFMFFNLGSINEELFTSIANFDKESFMETFPDTKNDSKEGFIILASCSRPLSRGKLSLSSSSPFDPPLIDPKYLTRIEDVKCLQKAIRMGAKLGSTKPMRELGARLHLPGYPLCSSCNQSLEDERYLECWIKMAAITAYHPVGTCTMGPAGHPLSVVDSKLRVMGVKNLRVVDSSIFPHQVSGNPNAATMMIAEKASDMIV